MVEENGLAQSQPGVSAVQQPASPSDQSFGGKHTPGPWKVFRSTDGRVFLGVGDREGGGITDVGDVSTNDQGLWRDGAEREANARLIAAAPALLEAAQAALPILLDEFAAFGPDEPETRAINSLRRAIALALSQEPGHGG